MSKTQSLKIYANLPSKGFTTTGSTFCGTIVSGFDCLGFAATFVESTKQKNCFKKSFKNVYFKDSTVIL